MMKIQMQEKKIRLPEDIHAYASKKVTKLERYFREEAEAFITFSVEKNRNNVELTVHAANTYFRASESTSNMYASIDAAVSTIERQIRKNKTRLERRLRQDAFARTVDMPNTFVPVEPEEEEFRILRTKRFPLKPMTRDEAILQLSLIHICPRTLAKAPNRFDSGTDSIVWMEEDEAPLFCGVKFVLQCT